MTVAIMAPKALSPSPPAARPGRRAFLGSVAALGAGALFPGCASVEWRRGAAHRRPPSHRAARLFRRAQGHDARPRPMVGREIPGGYGQERHRHRDHLAHQSRPAGLAQRRARRAQDRARIERIRGAARARPSRPVRLVRRDPLSRHRRLHAGNRVRVRYAQGRRHLPMDELRREACGRSGVLPDTRGSRTAARPSSTPIPPRPRAAGTSCRGSRSMRSRALWTRLAP